MIQGTSLPKTKWQAADVEQLLQVNDHTKSDPVSTHSKSEENDQSVGEEDSSMLSSWLVVRDVDEDSSMSSSWLEVASQMSRLTLEERLNYEWEVCSQMSRLTLEE